MIVLGRIPCRLLLLLDAFLYFSLYKYQELLILSFFGVSEVYHIPISFRPQTLHEALLHFQESQQQLSFKLHNHLKL
jgi:hypothetical protein